MNNKHLESHLIEFEKEISDFSTTDKLKALSMLQTEIESSEQTVNLLNFEQKIRDEFSIPKKQKKPKKKLSFLKWLLLIFFGSQVLFIVGIIILAIKFTPLIKIDESKNHVMLLGGMIDINGQSGRIKIFDQYQFVENNFSNEFIGEFELTGEVDEVLLNFSEGIYRFKNAKDQKVSWDCKLQNEPKEEIIKIDSSAFEMNLAKNNGSCDIEIPLDSKLTITGENGQITFNQPQYDLYTELKNGTIKVIPNKGVSYKLDLRVKNGVRDTTIPNSDDENAYEINIQIENGSFLVGE